MPRPQLLVEKGEQFFRDGFSIFVNKVHERFELPEHVHDFYEICYVWEGSGFHYIGDRTLRVAKGDLFFLPIGISHIFRPASADPHKPLVICNCIFDEELYHFLTAVLPERFHMYRFRELTANSGHWVHMRERSSEFAQLFESLYREFQQQRTGFETMMCGLLLQLFISIERSLEAAADIESCKGYNRMDTVLKSIRGRLHDKITLTSLAAEAGIGARQLQRLIHASTGGTFSDLLVHERMNRSCQLLADPAHRGLSIAEIAAAVGMSDLKRFYRLFKDKTGMTPAGYRLSNQ
ncbi:helix-turn-helix domain-containing protein [Bacillus sp. 3255]|uniref:helix-turn-helix domain-containing protein n=1 Tax=Bacillus sp. 3255 TaxID=2817904 RepID=UPI00285EF152|nr:helix-turn-helix domain-containing protein [Bacillus sp. 3255]MDR6879855.1 AraC family L-rhamnose operon transcriptional activator RhaR [Bacillus sp. 3255]